MSGVRFDVGRRGIGVSPAPSESHRGLLGGLASLPVRQPDLSTTGPRFDAGFFRLAVFSGADAGVCFGSPRAQPTGTRSLETHLSRIYSVAVAAGCGAFLEWQTRFAKKSRLSSNVGGKPFLHERAGARQPAPFRGRLARRPEN